MRAWYLASVLPVFLAACGGADHEAILETVRLTEQAQHEAMAAHDVNGVVRFYDEQAAVTVPGGASAVGREAITSAYTDMMADAGMALTVNEGPSWTAASGELAVTTFTGTLTRTDPQSGAKVEYPVENQTVWRKVDGKGWFIVSERAVTGEQKAATGAEAATAEAAAS